MRAIHVVPAITDQASGPSYSVPRLCESIMRAGVEVQLATLDQSSSPVSLPYVTTFPLGLGPRRLGISPKMGRWLEEAVISGRTDVIHNHGLWMMPNVYSGRACHFGRARLVVSPRGTLSAWALGRNALVKSLFWHALQAPALRRVACFHATAQREYEDIRQRGFAEPVCVLPNGIDVPPAAEAQRGARRTLLYLGRVHPIKGIDLLLRAWGSLGPRFPDWDLHIVGPDNAKYLSTIQALAGSLRLQRVFFLGPLYGKKKLQAYRSASLFVLPTHSENFGVTVAEALAAGTPAIVSKGAPWAEIEFHGAGWWIDIGVEPLIACLENALATSPSELSSMGQRGREWMMRDFCWDRIGMQFSTTYQWLLHGGVAPSWVRLE